jgi:hypothetical protein
VVDALLAAEEHVSIASIIAESKELDPEHKGVSKDGLLGNAEARAYYAQHRTARPQQRRRASSRPQHVQAEVAELINPVPARADRDQARVRQRYQRLTKGDLVDRLVTLEQAYAVERERWLHANDLVFWWMHAYTSAVQYLREVPAAGLP